MAGYKKVKKSDKANPPTTVTREPEVGSTPFPFPSSTAPPDWREVIE